MRKRIRGVRTWGAAALLTLGLAALLAGPGARAQEAEALPPPARPVAIYTTDRPTVTVEFAGDFGPVRATGLAEALPENMLRLTDPLGRVRDVRWSDLRELVQVRTASEGLPLGSFTTVLLGDPSALGRGGSGGYLSPALSAPGVGQSGWRLLELPAGRITLSSESFGRLSFETSRVSSMIVEPIRGTVVRLPEGTVRLEPLSGSVVGVPLRQVTALRRDLAAGTISVNLADGQIFTGRLVELPRVSIDLETPEDAPNIPLDRVVQLEVTVPALARTVNGP